MHAAGAVDARPVADLTAPGWLARRSTSTWWRPLCDPGRAGALRRGRGTHVFVNSGSGLRANPGWAAYTASKFGLRGFADALRAEEAEHGVRVTTVYPGRTATPMQEQVHGQEGQAYDPDQWIRPETVAGEIVRLLDLATDATIPDLVIRPR